MPIDVHSSTKAGATFPRHLEMIQKLGGNIQQQISTSHLLDSSLPSFRAPTMAILTEEERELDPYALLNLDTTATEKDVQRAYRKLTLKWHPDKNSAPEAERMFHLISLAQNILRDVDKRKFVDTKLAQSRAAAARREVMDAKRKVKVDVSVMSWWVGVALIAGFVAERGGCQEG